MTAVHPIYLNDRMVGRNNNLNLLRFMAAASVLVSHSFPISYGAKTLEPLETMTGRGLGGHAVLLFFILSGLLISASYENSRSFAKWTLSRIFRLFPGLLGVILVTVLVLGPLVTELPWGEYFSKSATWRYVAANMRLFGLQYDLPGVFQHNPFGPPINGSLWSLRYEVLCYVILGICGVLGLLRRPSFAWLFLALAIAAQIVPALPGLTVSLGFVRESQMIQLGSAFGLGAAAYVLRERLLLDGRLVAIGAVLVVAAHGTAMFPCMLLLATVYTALWIGYVPQGRMLEFNRLGDYSYGIYLYAFPIQQLIAWLWPGVEWWQNSVLAMVLTGAFAYLSWHLIEKRAMAAGKRLAREIGDSPVSFTARRKLS